jgi:predicted anti-sigma-YlaC factor YlaD
MGRLTPRRCDRARQWISLDVDGELSEFERALLDAHLGRCADCGAFRDDAQSFTSLLRAAPLEALTHPVALPSRRSRLARPIRVAAAAVAVVAVTGLAAVVGTFRTEATLPASLAQARAQSDFSVDSGLRELRRSQLQPPPLVQRGIKTPPSM